MITVVQRVRRASVHVDGTVISAIAHGALLLVGVEVDDGPADAEALAAKVARLRFFPGATPMDKTLVDVGGACLVVSQFTLAAALAKGNRPSFVRAAQPERAEPLYLRVAETLRAHGLDVQLGRFGAAMQVELHNDGPVTFVLRTRDGKLIDPGAQSLEP
jgi:D-tyrosyl-tRNA(Tyr) deacylase